MSAMLDYMQLCRLCLVKEKVNVPIFDEQSDVRQIYLKISACLPVKISRDDSLPKNICDSCCYKVDLLYQFWNTTVNAEKQLTEWLGNLGVDISKTAGTTSAQHSTPAESIVLKQENHDPPEVQNVEQIPEFLPSTQIYTNYNQQFASSNVPNDNLNSSVNNEPAKVKRRGRPPGSTKKKPPPATQTSTNTEDESNDEGSTLNEPDLEDSDESMEDGKRIAKEEQESDLEYEENEALEPTTFVGVTSETPCDTEQPGPSGLNKPATITASEAGLQLTLPKGIRINKITNNTHENNQEKMNETHHENKNKENDIPLVETIVKKLNKIHNLKIDVIKNDKTEDTATIIANLNNCGLTIKKSYDTPKINGHKKGKQIENTAKTINEKETFNAIDALDFLNDDLSESDYEIETLEEYESDFEFISSIKMEDSKKRKRKSNSDFIKIRSTSFMCVMCLKKFTTLQLLKDHMNSGTPCNITMIPCEICKREFPSKSRLTAHMEIHKEKPQYFCDKCGQSFRNTNKLASHLESMHTEYFDAIGDSFHCKLCENEATSRDLILQHINTTHLHVSTFLCHVCGKSFMNEIRLKFHIMTHSDTKSYLCQICSKAFKTPHSLQAHIKTHSEVRRFVCDECGKSFKKSCTLRDHKKTHAHEFSFTCFICDKRFVSQPALNVHLKKHL